MSHELYSAEAARPRIVIMSQESSTEVTEDWAKVPYGVTRYAFQQEGATEDDAPYVKIERRDTGGDMSFHATSAEQRSQHGGARPAGPGPGAELSLEVQYKLDEPQAAAVAEQLADLMFRVSEIEI
jgi:hypothetical protein